MVKKTRYGDFTFGWEMTLGNMEANPGELSHLENARLALKAFLDRVTRLRYEQGYHEAERQRATREMQEALAEGEKTATFLRMGIKLVYGNDNDKLLEFGIQPLRRRSGQKRQKAAAPEAPREEKRELVRVDGGEGGATGRQAPPVTPEEEKRPLPGRHDLREPLVEDGAAPFEGDRPGGLQQPGEGLRSLEQMDGDVDGGHQSLIEDPELADGLVAVVTGEEQGVGSVPVRLLVDADQRLAPGAGEHGGGDESEPPGREDRHGSEPPAQALAAPEQTEAVSPAPGNLLDPPGPGDIGLGGGGRLVPLGETAEKLGGEDTGVNGRGKPRPGLWSGGGVRE